MPADQDASKCYDPTAEEYYYGYDCTIVSTGSKIPTAAGFTESKQASEETAMRVTRSALAVDQPIWVIGDSAYDTLDWHDDLLTAGIVLVAPYNLRKSATTATTCLHGPDWCFAAGQVQSVGWPRSTVTV